MVPMKNVASIIMFIAFLLVMIALCTNEWYKEEKEGTTAVYGLWNTCRRIVNKPFTCKFLPEDRKDLPPKSLTAIRGLLGLGILFLTGAIGYPPFFKQMSTGPVKLEFMAILCLSAGACSLISMIIFTHEVNTRTLNPQFGYSYAIGWVGTFAILVASAVSALSARDVVYTDTTY